MISESTQDETKNSSEQLKLVYDDIVHRLANDNDSSTRIITISGVLLAILGTFIAATPHSDLLAKIFIGLAGTSFVGSVFSGILASRAYHDLKCIPTCLRWPFLNSSIMRAKLPGFHC